MYTHNMVLFADLYSSNMTISTLKIQTDSCISCVSVSLRHMYVCMYACVWVCMCVGTLMYTCTYMHCRGLHMKADIIVFLIILHLRY